MLKGRWAPRSRFRLKNFADIVGSLNTRTYLRRIPANHWIICFCAEAFCLIITMKSIQSQAMDQYPTLPTDLAARSTATWNVFPPANCWKGMHWGKAEGCQYCIIWLTLLSRSRAECGLSIQFSTFPFYHQVVLCSGVPDSFEAINIQTT